MGPVSLHVFDLNASKLERKVLDILLDFIGLGNLEAEYHQIAVQTKSTIP